jgi:hypothetical protein
MRRSDPLCLGDARHLFEHRTAGGPLAGARGAFYLWLDRAMPVRGAGAPEKRTFRGRVHRHRRFRVPALHTETDFTLTDFTAR